MPPSRVWAGEGHCLRWRKRLGESSSSDEGPCEGKLVFDAIILNTNSGSAAIGSYAVSKHFNSTPETVGAAASRWASRPH